MKFVAAPGLRIPVPGRAGQFLPDTGEGIEVDPLSPYYARLIADGDLVAVGVPRTSTPTPRASKREGDL